MSKYELRKDFDCSCCKPARQIFYRSLGRRQIPYHEDDRSLAVKK